MSKPGILNQKAAHTVDSTSRSLNLFSNNNIEVTGDRNSGNTDILKMD